MTASGRTRGGAAGTVAMVGLGTVLVLVTYVTPMATAPLTVTDLGAGADGQAWVLSSMSVGLAAALLAAGVVGDTFGRRRAYVHGLVGVALGALLCAAAPTVGWFVLGRLVQGVGGGAVLACGLALVAHATTLGRERERATAVWGASVAVGISVGFVAAAPLTVVSGWRGAYALVVVAALLLVLPTRARVAESASGRSRRVDLAGLVLLAAAMTAAVAALTRARTQTDTVTLLLAGAVVLLLGGFAVAERRVADPLLDLTLLREPRFVAATTGSLVLGVGMIGLSSFVPTVVQEGLDDGIGTGSLLVLAWSVASVATSLAVRGVRRPLGGPLPLALAMLVVGVGQLLALGLDETDGAGRLVPSLLVCGLATGVLNALLGREAVASVPADRAAMGSGANNTARYLGAAVGITVVTVIATGPAGAPRGAGLVAGWNTAVVVLAAVSLLGAAGIALLARADRRT